MPDCGRVISQLPVDQAKLILCVSDFAAIAEFLFHAQGLLGEFQSFVQVFQFAVAIRDITQGDRFTMAVVTGPEQLDRFLKLWECWLWTFLGIELLSFVE